MTTEIDVDDDRNESPAANDEPPIQRVQVEGVADGRSVGSVGNGMGPRGAKEEVRQTARTTDHPKAQPRRWILAATPTMSAQLVVPSRVETVKIRPAARIPAMSWGSTSRIYSKKS